LLLELLEDEAKQVINAVSATEVRFGGLRFDEVVELGTAGAPPLGPDIAIGHEACSDGVIYAGGSTYSLSRMK
jgi:hypothetical protein